MSRYVREVLLPIGKTALAIGAPIAVLHLLYTMTNSYRDKSDDERAALRRQTSDIERMAITTALPILLAAGTLSYFGSSR